MIFSDSIAKPTNGYPRNVSENNFMLRKNFLYSTKFLILQRGPKEIIAFNNFQKQINCKLRKN